MMTGTMAHTTASTMGEMTPATGAGNADGRAAAARATKPAKSIEELFAALMVALERRKTGVDTAAAKLTAEKREWANLFSSVQRTVDPTPVELNVGGKRFQTSAATLTSVKRSFFDGLCSGLSRIEPCADGSDFIDRPSQVFEHVLNFMRGVELHYELLSNTELVLLRTEAQFYRLDALVTAINQAMAPPGHAPAAAAPVATSVPSAAVVAATVDAPAVQTPYSELDIFAGADDGDY
eukprot:TRINITY_DN3335_c0_g2_i1.p1 TRINITY_DN3335_c0_g2~~TRINITY_DN3335_c0_g2_i1.p1  ORF type:complete len:237 (+),score=53.54 TRINITY_DN3335_c0_g2_i1:59-769(+)